MQSMMCDHPYQQKFIEGKMYIYVFTILENNYKEVLTLRKLTKLIDQALHVQ